VAKMTKRVFFIELFFEFEP